MMTTYVALLRAVNVGGTGKLPMTELRRLCAEAGFERVEAYIASGNVVFDSKASAKAVKSALERAINDFAGKPIGIAARTARELQDIVVANPFGKAKPNQVVAIFLDAAPPRDTLERITGQGREELRLGRREIFVHYPDGQARSKLKILGALAGTARNMNTVAALAAMAGARA
jgi:uncharacterized protein (DUF1697 family)